jgi:D-serine deaminase-like pyridoxal phosphate-dependent protein
MGVPEARIIGQSEEHLVVETPAADRLRRGELIYAWPYHICPTCALHKELLVVDDGRITGAWEVAARDRRISV